VAAVVGSLGQSAWFARVLMPCTKRNHDVHERRAFNKMPVARPNHTKKSLVVQVIVVRVLHEPGLGRVT